MKKLLLASLSVAVMAVGSMAMAEDAAPPAAPTGSTATPAPGSVKAARKAAREAKKAERAERKAEHGAMVEKVKAACSADIQATGCSQELGEGLMKCMHAYKESHKEFSLSESCKSAVHDGREMRKEHKAERAHAAPGGAAPAAPAAGAPTH